MKGLAENERDVLIYALYPTTGKRFLRWKYGLEAPPPEVRPRTMEDVRREEELIAMAREGRLVEREDGEGPQKGPGLRRFNVFVKDQHYSIEVEEVDGRPRVRSVSDTEPIVKKETRTERKKLKAGWKKTAAEKKKEAPEPAVGASQDGELSLIAPMPGMIVQYEVKEGDTVQVGDVLVILEAMKMQNSLTSNYEGTVRSLKVSPGTSVEKNQVLLTITR